MLSITEYVPSMYNLFFAHNHGEYQYIVANTFSGAIMSADYELKNFLAGFDAKQYHKFKLEHPDVHDYLLAHNFLVEADLDELDRVKIRFQQVKYNDRCMHLTILPTIDCNLACIYCYEKNKAMHMTPEIIQKVKDFVNSKIDSLSDLGVTWYGGEPLLQSSVIEELSSFFISLCDEKKIKYGASMITNGTLLNPAIVDMLVQSRIGRLQVTLDGPEEVHNSRRFYRKGAEGSFWDIVNGLEACKGKIPVNIRINVDETNIERFKELIGFLFERGLLGNESRNGVSLGLVKEWTKKVKLENEKMLSMDDFEVHLEEMSKTLQEIGVSSGDNYNFSPQTPCGAVNINNFLVSPYGNLRKCWIHSTEEGEEVGDLENGLNLSKAAAVKWTAYDPTLDEECAACAYLPFCAGGCPYEMANKLIDKEKYCQHTMQYVEDNVVRAVKSKNKLKRR